MNPQDLIALAKEIYIQMVAHDPTDWDKQKMARDAIESATQFFLALQSEKEGSAYPSVVLPPLSPPPGSPTASTVQQMKQSLAAPSWERRTIGSNQMAAGRGMVRKGYFGEEMG